MHGAQITVLNGIIIMKKIKMIVELEYDDEIMHANEKDEIDLFYNDILMADREDDECLVLFSNYLGDDIGTIKVLEMLDNE